MSTLKAQHLTKKYKSRMVVKDVSLEVHSGEIVGLLGPNGAGKTTSFYMIVGLIRPQSGEIFIDETPVTSMPIHKRSAMGLGYLPQDTSIFKQLTVAENIMAILELQQQLNKAARNAALEHLLQEFHIQHLRDEMAFRLSGGEIRRTEIARTLAANPKFILLDEPFAGIDPLSIVDIKRIIRYLASRGIGILITDHNVRETLDICSRAYIVNEGLVIASGPPQDILNHRTVRAVYLGEEF